MTGIAERGDAWEHAAAWHRRYVIEIPDETRADILAQVRAFPPDDVPHFMYAAFSTRWARTRANAAAPRVMEDILAIPNESLRLFVARALAGSDGDSSTGKEDVQHILNSLSPNTREAIRTRSLVYPPDGVYHEPPPNDYHREGVYKWYEEWTRRAE